MNKEGKWLNMEDLVDIDRVKPEDLVKDVKVNMTIKFNSKKTSDLGVTSESLLHEFSLHLLPYFELIKQLRNGTKVGQDFINEWKKVTALQGTNNYNNGYKQHTQFGKGNNSQYNILYGEMKSQMTNPAVQNSFESESIKDGMNYLQIKFKNAL